MQFTLNGQKREYQGDPEKILLKYLREELNITTPKDGCSGQGTCGCCTVHLNGKPVLSCLTKMKKVEGCEVLTTEGLEKRVQEAFSKAFVKKGGIQCGYCTPGIVMAAAALLKKNLNPSREEVTQAINPNLCRCTGYKKIVDSILCAAESIRENKPIELAADVGKVGTRLPKYDCEEAVLGKRPFVADMRADNMLFGALKFSDHPRARILKIDFSEAQKVPGVVRVVTSKDVPGDRTIGLIVQDWPLMIAEGENTRYIGDVLAGVIAKTEDIAREAAKKIRVEYEVLEPLCDPFEAMKPEAPKLHANHPTGNILEASRIKRGNVDKAIQDAAFVVQGRYTTQRIEHAFLETECCFAKPWSLEGQPGVEVFSQGQGAYEDRKQIGKLLGLPLERVKVVQVPNGGGFGGKEDLTVQGHAALYSYLLGVPVRVALTRDESICMHPKRHPFIMDYLLGCDASGRLTVLKASMVADSGAYASVGGKVVERAVGHSASAYVVPNIEVTGNAVYTNNIPCGAMRGFGVNQAAFAMESCIDQLCEKGGFDRWKFRFENAVTEGQMISTGEVIQGGSGVRAALLALKDDFYKAKYAGLAVGIKNTGIGNGMADIGRAKIVVGSGGRVTLHHGWTEMGQGVHTMAVQSFCEETGIPAEKVSVKVETDNDVVCGMTTSSRGTSLVGHAVIAACKEFKKDLTHGTLEQLEGKEYFGEWVCDWTTKPGHEEEVLKAGKPIVTHYSYGWAAQLVVLNDEGKIEKVVAAHDAGKIMNPTLFEGQIEGSVHMGLGYAITEELVLEKGRPVSTRLSKCGILRAKETPQVVVKGVEVHDPHGPFGAKGVGEIGLVPTAGAVAGALYQYDKIRRYTLPLRERKLLGK